MIAQEEIAAIMQLLSRTPMTQAEQLWCLRFVAKLQQIAVAQQKESDKDEE